MKSLTFRPFYTVVHCLPVADSLCRMRSGGSSAPNNTELKRQRCTPERIRMTEERLFYPCLLFFFFGQGGLIYSLSLSFKIFLCSRFHLCLFVLVSKDFSETFHATVPDRCGGQRSSLNPLKAVFMGSSAGEHFPESSKHTFSIYSMTTRQIAKCWISIML